MRECDARYVCAHYAHTLRLRTLRSLRRLRRLCTLHRMREPRFDSTRRATKEEEAIANGGDAISRSNLFFPCHRPSGALTYVRSALSSAI